MINFDNINEKKGVTIIIMFELLRSKYDRFILSLRVSVHE